jgi:dTDP-4-dehydrorhamnose 3,5-epimerase-like enzyme
MIDGVEIKQLRVNADERGFLMEILREDDEIFERFGQVYVSLNYPGVVRAWHYHKLQDDFINFPTKAYNRAEPDEYRLPWDTEEIPYDWALKNR